MKIFYIITLLNFKKFYTFLLPTSCIILLFFLVIGLVASFNAPIDYQQFNAVKIMYIHVPAAWISLIIYSMMAIYNILAFTFKNHFLHVISRNIAPIGCLFTFLTLITGSIWGKPIWGTFWVWDARLTSVLLLFFLYIGYILLVNAFDNLEQGRKIAAILSIIGFINIPLIKFSVELFNTLHQKSSIGITKGSSIDNSMLLPLLYMFVFCLFYSLFITLIKLKTEVNNKKIKKIEIRNLSKYKLC